MGPLCGAAASLLRRALRARGCRFAAVGQIVKPARLHFARTARALTGRYMCERGDLSEFLAARTCASCWLDNGPDSVWQKPVRRTNARAAPNSDRTRAVRAKCSIAVLQDLQAGLTTASERERRCDELEARGAGSPANVAWPRTAAPRLAGPGLRARLSLLHLPRSEK